MTLLAGILSRNKDTSIAASTCEVLNRSISRNPNDEVKAFKDSRCYLIKVDIGAFGERAFRRDDNGNVSMLAGEPLIALGGENDHWQSRTHDLDLLHDRWQQGDWNILTRARGVFCAAHYQTGTGTLSLIADKLCVRPLYYWANNNYVVFASALRILESLVQIPRKMDLRAVSEMVGIGIPLGSRTPYQSIARLNPAEIIHFTSNNISREQYWRWDDIPVSSSPEQELVSEVYQRFTAAVGRRIRNDTTTVAYLSGGLDTRCIVAALRSRDVRVHTFNFARRGTQDQFFGAEFSRQAGTIHEEVPTEDASPDWPFVMAHAWNESRNRTIWPAERGALVWGGFGGSAELGATDISQSTIDLMRARGVDAGIEACLLESGARIPQKLLNEDLSDAIARMLHLGIREEMDDIHCADKAHGFSVFQMIRRPRHFFNHFENIDLHRVELQMPFLDSDLLASITATPLDLRVGHKFYTKLLTHFAPVVTSVPWQTYPDHETCPLPIPPGLIYQWDSVYQASRSKSRKRAVFRQATGLLKMNNFPARLLKRRNLLLATLIHGLGLRNYEYVINAAEIYCRYWALCDGHYEI